MEFIRRKIKIPKSLGETLKNARKKKELTLEQAEEETKVRAKYLEALENGRYELLPASVYTAGFLAKYAEFLGLNKEHLIEQFSQERGKVYNHAKIMVERKIREPLFSITPKFITITGVIVVLAGLLGYITYSVHQFTSPPNLAISSPSADQVIKEENVHIIGKTDEGATLMINGENVRIDDNGNFNQIVKLNSGLNSFEVRSINGLKKENVKLIKVLADIPGVEMPVTVDQPVDITADAADVLDKATTDTVIKNTLPAQDAVDKTTKTNKTKL
jgi:cytoskeletal protein RodZ